MAPSLLLFFSSLPFLFNARAQSQDRAPHGLAYDNPMAIALSPSAVDFFHPNAQGLNYKSPCGAASGCAPLSLAAQLDSSLAYESVSREGQGASRGVGAAGIVGIVFGFVFFVMLGMGAYYVVVTRRANSSRANSVLPDA